MIEVWIDGDEWYPVYSFSKGGLGIRRVMIPDEKYDWVVRVEREFLEVQDYLASLVEEK